MKRFVFIMALCAMSIVSCQRESLCIKSDALDANSSPYAISEEQAIKQFSEFLLAFDEDITRTSQRTVSSITGINYDLICPQTRSLSAEDVDKLFYIVEFGDGEGSAVIGADSRVESVYAILDDTVLTQADFENAVNGENTDNIATYVAGLIVQNAVDDISMCYSIPNVEIRDDRVDYVTINTVIDKINPLLNTKWNQQYPYNNLFPYQNGSNSMREYAGCGTIAVAQVLNYLTYPANITINGHDHDWSIISCFTYDSNITNPYYINCISRFIYDLAIEMNAEYVDGGTAVPVSESVSLFREVGYSNVDFETLTSTKAYNMIQHNKPFYTYGLDTESNTAHAWVIDGWKEIRTVEKEVISRNNLILSERIIDEYTTQYAHCNFGWGGLCDGYYTFTNFNTTYCRPDDMIESEYGDYAGTTSANYTSNFGMISYNY